MPSTKCRCKILKEVNIADSAYGAAIDSKGFLWVAQAPSRSIREMVQSLVVYRRIMSFLPMKMAWKVVGLFVHMGSLSTVEITSGTEPQAELLGASRW